MFLFRRKLRLVDIFLPSFFFFSSLSSRTHAFSAGRRNVWLEVALGKTNKVCRFARRQPSTADRFNKMQPEKKAFGVLVSTRIPTETRREKPFGFAPDQFPRRCLPNFSFFLSLEAKLTSVIAEIAAETSWKINLRVFEIPEWIDWACLL